MKLDVRFDDQENGWIIDRLEGNYGTIGGQLDKLWHDIDQEKLDKTGSWYKTIKQVKDDNPKPS